MSSGFNIGTASPSEESRIKLFESSDSRYCYYKTRSYGRLLFVKCIAPRFKGDLITCEALNKEFRIGYPLEHPNIMRYYKMEDDCIFSEYIEGKTLREMLDGGDERLNDGDFINKVCRQLLEGLHYMHSQGVLHLDIKPENIMISRIGNNVKIIDLGCAYSSTFDSTPGYTFNYKAPEQLGGDVNTYTDIYQVGKVMEELTACLPEWKKWEKFIGKCTADDATDRFADDAEALAGVPSVRKYTNKMLLFAALPLVAFLVYMSVNKADKEGSVESETINADTTVTAVQRDVEVRHIPVETVHPPIDGHANQISAEQRLSSEIKRFVANYYDANIRELCLTPESAHKNRDLYYKKCKAMLDAAIEYGHKLGEGNPEYAAFIQTEVMNVVSAQVSVGQAQFLKPFGDDVQESADE